MPEPDPPRRAPTLLWLCLGLATIVAFAAVVFLMFGHAPTHVVGPPPGAPT